MKKYILIDAKNSIMQIVKEAQVIKRDASYLVDGDSYTRESYSYLNIYDSMNEAKEKATKRNSEILKNVVITKDNIHLYYEFMSDEDLEKYTNITKGLFIKRTYELFKVFKVDKYTLHNFKKNNEYIYGSTYFGVKDTLKPIDEYIEEIRASVEYKVYTRKNKINILQVYILYYLDINNLLISELNNIHIDKIVKFYNLQKNYPTLNEFYFNELLNNNILIIQDYIYNSTDDIAIIKSSREYKECIANKSI